MGSLVTAGQSGTHAVVVGMHRSGTSAVANSLAQLGFALPDVTDLITPGPFNERGYWESRRFVTYSDRVLARLGGTWSAPPTPDPGWELSEDAATSELRVGAREFVQREFTASHLVLKDPRLCITLPMWRTALAEPPVAILVLRDPLEVAQSLQRRNDFPLSLGLALWRRYVQQSVVSVEGLPVFIIEFGQLLAEPHRWVTELAKFVGDYGTGLRSDHAAAALTALEPALRHHTSDSDDEVIRTSALVSEQREFASVVLSRAGGHADWSRLDVPPEPAWVDDVIGLERSGEMVSFARTRAENELKWIKRSRLFTATKTFWRLTATGPALSDDEPAPPGTGQSSASGTSARPGWWSRAARRMVDLRGTPSFQQIPHQDNPRHPALLPEFRLCAVIKTWMDEDIIEATVRNAFAQGADAVFLVDNASTDATLANAIAAGAVVSEVYDTEVFDGRLVQPLVNAVVARESLRSGAEHVWWLLLDSDEFPEAPGGRTVREYLGGLDRRFRVVGATYINHLPSDRPEYVEGFHPIDFQPLCYVFEPANFPPCPLGHWKHPLQRFDRNGQFVLSNDGAHLAYSSDPLVEPTEGVFIHHFQYRDEQITRAKLDLLIGPGANRVALHESAGFSGFARRRRSLDAVYRQQWEAMDVPPNRREAAHRSPAPWAGLESVKRWYERDDAKRASDHRVVTRDGPRP